MQSLFDQNTTKEIINRIDKLQSTSVRSWGTMDVAQMLAHCVESLRMATGALKPQRIFIGRIIGSFIKSIYYNDKLPSKNSPTADEVRIPGQRYFDIGRPQLNVIIQQFVDGGLANCTTHPHPFFGRLTADQWGKGMYKHLDHHLRQFGV